MRRTALVFGSAASLVLHACVLLWFNGLATLPPLAFELTKPDIADFGVVDAPAEATPTPPAEPAPPPPAPAAQPAKIADAPAPPKPKPAPPPPPAVAAEAGAVGQFAPKGAQVALRLDLDRVRATPLAEDTAALLANLPDVRALLDGSGVEPMRDLSRLFLASPDLRREHVVMAGQYKGGENIPRQAVEQLARERGEAADWRTKRGIRVAPWRNIDATPRVLALVGPNVFAITREEDLGRVLAVARALNARSRANDSGADALVHMAERELMNVSVENVRSFVRARAHEVPARMEASIRGGEGQLDVRVEALFASAEESGAARTYWSDLRDRYARHPLVALVGMDSLLRAATIEQRDAKLVLSALVPFDQAQLVLRWLRDSLPSNHALGTARTP